jgi:diguanylate cyclase (GGDEF)-like protein
MPVMKPWLPRCVWLCAAGALLAAPATATSTGPAGTPAAAQAAPPTVGGDAAARLATIERELRARPQQAAAALDGAAAAAAPGSLLQVEMLLAQALLSTRSMDSERLERLLQGLDRIDTPAARAAAQLARGRWQALHGALGRADRLMEEALALLPATAPPQLRLRFLKEHARVKEYLAQFEDSVRLSQEALTLAEAAAAPDWLRSELHAALAYTYYQAQQLDRAESVNREAIKLATASGDALALSGAMTTEGILLGARGRTAEELVAMQAAIDQARAAGAQREIVLGLANMADFYLKRADYPTALQLARQALPLARELRDPVIESVALTNAGLALISLGERAEGTRLVRESLLLEERAGALTSMAQIQLELGLYLEKAGHLPEAWGALKEHRRMADEVFQREHQQAVLELQEGFDHETRKREMHLLKSENALKEAQLEGRKLQQQLTAVATVAGALLLAVVAVLVRRMRSSNRALRASNAQLQVASERDPLTGLANRRHFQAVMKTTTDNGVLDGSLLLIDIDHFKRINDEHGHAVGDSVLVEIASRLLATLREQDLTVRWGGEEFLVVVRAMPPDQVEALAERLLMCIGGTPVRHGRQRLAVTASIGFATFPLQPARQATRWERAIDLVDTAMYLAKAHGRNRAYGVRALQADDASGGLPATTLETAWRDGRADLTRVAGPAPAELPEAAL